jgi:hypothetical protein
MATDDADLRLDGNAAGGLLAELFSFEMTLAQATCAGCGAVAPIGAAMAYGHEMGTVLRCPGCDTALIRVARTHGRYFLDLRGVISLRIGDPPA